LIEFFLSIFFQNYQVGYLDFLFQFGPIFKIMMQFNFSLLKFLKQSKKILSKLTWKLC